MSEITSKICPYCAENVKILAKVCPRCRQWFSMFSLRNPTLLGILLAIAFVLSGILLLKKLEQVMDPGISFSPYRDSILIIESRMTIHPDVKQPSVYVVVLVTNKSDVAWQDVQLDLRFYDKTGAFIDACSKSGYGIIYSHGDLAFRVDVPIHPLADYDSYKVFVRSAKDARARF